MGSLALGRVMLACLIIQKTAKVGKSRQKTPKDRQKTFSASFANKRRAKVRQNEVKDDKNNKKHLDQAIVCLDDF